MQVPAYICRTEDVTEHPHQGWPASIRVRPLRCVILGSFAGWPGLPTMRRTLLILSSSLVLSACNCGKSQGLLETSGILVVSPDALEFGAVTEFTNKTMSLSLENTGRGALTSLKYKRPGI